MKLRTGILVLLCLSLLFSLCACAEEPPMQTTIPVTEPTAPDDAYTLYAKACTRLQEAPNLTVTVTFDQSRLVNGETYTEKMSSTQTYRNKGSSVLAAYVQQDINFGNYTTQYLEYYTGGKVYCQAGGSYFRAATMTMYDFHARQIPWALMDSSLYGSVVKEDQEDGSVRILFTLPTAVESWACGNVQTTVLEATGVALLDPEGNLVETTYSAKYSVANIVYQVQATAVPVLEAANDLDAKLSQIPTDCTEISYFDAPRRILQVVGDVYTAKAMSVEYTENLYSAAYGRRRTQTSSFDVYGTGSNFMARSSYEMSLLDYSNTADVSKEVVTFLDGVCTSVINGAEPVIQNGVTAQQMREFCEDSILAALFTPNYLLNAEIAEDEEFLCIRFTGTEAFADTLCSSIYAIFGANLDHYAQSYTTPMVGGYLCISKYTGLPTALGLSLSRVHVIEGVSCALDYQLDQKMQLASATAYETITGEPAPQTTPDKTAAPLFYKVTNEEGKTMWLLGTVHVGDNRTERLPQAIYDAFAESTALAVEFNINTFEELMLSDPALLAQLSEAYYYSNGTTVRDHISDTLWKQLENMMLISGGNRVNSQYYRTVIWWNLIGDFYLQQDPTLSAERGVDQLLLDMALAAEKPIFEIESGLSQIQMLTGFSDALQAMLLEDLLKMDSYSYTQELHRLYELWCNGDKEGLEQELRADTDGMTETELVLQQEYDKAMYDARNAVMLRAALEYLKGEDTVFYAVGYAHLLGETGLIVALQEAGYTVEQVVYS